MSTTITSVHEASVVTYGDLVIDFGHGNIEEAWRFHQRIVDGGITFSFKGKAL